MHDDIVSIDRPVLRRRSMESKIDLLRIAIADASSILFRSIDVRRSVVVRGELHCRWLAVDFRRWLFGCGKCSCQIQRIVSVRNETGDNPFSFALRRRKCYETRWILMCRRTCCAETIDVILNPFVVHLEQRDLVLHREREKHFFSRTSNFWICRRGSKFNSLKVNNNFTLFEVTSTHVMLLGRLNWESYWGIYFLPTNRDIEAND